MAVNFLIGYGASLVGGGIVVWVFLAVMRSFLGRKPESSATRVAPWLTGAIERGFFTTLVAFRIFLGVSLVRKWMPSVKLPFNF